MKPITLCELDEMKTLEGYSFPLDSAGKVSFVRGRLAPQFFPDYETIFPAFMLLQVTSEK